MNTSKEYKELVRISKLLHEEYRNENTMWINSPFEWIISMPSRSKGAIGEKIVSMWLASYNFNVARSPDTQADRVVEGKRVEIKLSTLWKAGGYKFQQLRDQNYDFAIMLGLAPHDAHCWVIKKSEIIRLWKEEHIIEGQHTGHDGADTAWLHINPEDAKLFSPYGGSLKKALELVAQFTGFTPKSLTEELSG